MLDLCWLYVSWLYWSPFLYDMLILLVPVTIHCTIVGYILENKRSKRKLERSLLSMRKVVLQTLLLLLHCRIIEVRCYGLNSWMVTQGTEKWTWSCAHGYLSTRKLIQLPQFFDNLSSLPWLISRQAYQLTPKARRVLEPYPTLFVLRGYIVDLYYWLVLVWLVLDTCYLCCCLCKLLYWCYEDVN